MNNNFKATTLANGIKITDVATGYNATLTYDKGAFFTENSEMSAKDWQYVLNIFKFIREWSSSHMPKSLAWKERFTRITKVINTLDKPKTFRNLSTAVRRAFDDGKVLSNADFQAKFFYEGNMNGQGIRAQKAAEKGAKGAPAEA